MNKDNAAEYLPLVQALAEGKTIQIKETIGSGWFDDRAPDFNLPPREYRIKPEPREIWVNLYGDGGWQAHADEKSALACFSGGRGDCAAIKFREVTDEQD